MALANEILAKFNKEALYADYSFFYKLNLSISEKKKVPRAVQTENVMLSDIWDEYLISAICGLTAGAYPHHKVTQQFINCLLNKEINEKTALMEEFFWKLLMSFPPGPIMFHYYGPLLFDHYLTLGDKDSETHSLFYVLIEGLTACLRSSKSKSKSRIHSKQHTADSFISIADKTDMSCYELNQNKIRRFIIGLKFVCNILETDFVFWVNSKNLKSFVESRPLLSHLLWPKAEKFGSVNEEVRKVLYLYKLVSKSSCRNFQVANLIERLINLIGEVIRYNDSLEGINYPYFGIKTNNFARELSTVFNKNTIKNEKSQNNLNKNSLTVNLKQPWLRLLVCSHLLSSITGCECSPNLTGVYDILEFLAHIKGKSNERTNKSKTSPNSSLIGELHKLQLENDKELLHSACEENDLEKVKALLTSPELDINATNSRGYTALHLASYLGNTSIIQELLSFRPKSKILQKPLNTRARGPDGYTPLMCAVTEGHADVSKLLLQHTGSVLLRDINKFNQTPMDLSSRDEITTILKYYTENNTFTSNSSTIIVKPELKEIVVTLCVELIQAYFCTYKTREIYRILKKQEKNSSLRKSERQLQMNYKIDYEQYNRDVTIINKLKKLSPKLEEMQEFQKLKEIYNQILSVINFR